MKFGAFGGHPEFGIFCKTWVIRAIRINISSFVRHPRRLDPTADRDRRCQARQAPEETPVRIASRKRRRSSASSTRSQGPQRKRVCTEGGCQGLGGEIRHPTAVARSVPSAKGDEKTQSLGSTSQEKPPLPALFKFKQNPPVATALARLPIDPISDLNEVFPPTSAEFLPKGTPVDPDRKSPWADSWGPRPSTLRRPILGRLNTYASTHPLLVGINATGISYENLLQLIRDFGDHPVLKHAASTKFRTAVLAAAPVASAHDLTGSYIVPWSELEQMKFPPLVLEYDGNFKRIAMKLPNKTSTQVMVYFTEHYQELIKTDIVQHIMRHLPIL
ncbi:hypothetical protein B0H14DRAFT_3147058 [Mycena olivaceomarginata]|nr:hypothetical protein B0H14DRAFT_3147058 [Mycena olivaceomarginata]